MAINLQNSLTQLAMWPVSGVHTGLRPVDARRKKSQHPQEVRTLERANELGASHVYFRFFPEPDRAPKAEVFIFDCTDQLPDEPKLAEAARLLWNSGAAPLVFVFRADRVDILNAMKEPKLEFDSLAPKYQPAETIRFANELAGELEEEKRKRFSALAFDNGSFWENPENSPLFTNTKTALQSMLKGMRDLRAKAESEGFEKEVVNRLLILCLMIKFLEDRRAFSGQNFFGEFSKGATEFFHVLNKPKAFLKCLASLEERFNGDVFSLDSKIKAAIRKADLATFSEFVEGKTYKKQAHFWKLYSFAHLPVEVISYLYEDFIEPCDEDGKPQKTSVYTPHHLVELILDEAMPLKKLRAAKGVYKVIDPACGSGVFLVGAFRRLVDAWRVDNDWKRPTAAVLKKLLKQNIHGIDNDSQAVELTTFSLCLAVCGQMEPSRIWSTLQFDPLKDENIHYEDFFQVTKDRTLDGKFDLVIGNPPFKSSVKEGIPKEIEKANRGDFPELPDRQICYLFLREAPRLLKKNALGYLILKDGFLYNIGTESFRRKFLETYHVPHILDFVSIRGMFTGQGRKESADVKVVTVGFQNRDPDFNKPLLHVTCRKTARVRSRQGFELDAYDLHWISRRLACENPIIWKVNLLGGGRLLEMFRKYSNYPTLGDYLKEMKTECGWLYGEGRTAGAGKNTKELIGTKFLADNGKFLSNRLPERALQKYSSKEAKWVQKKLHQSSPVIMIREHEVLPIAYSNEAIVYDKNIVGIVAPKKDKKRLHKLWSDLIFLQQSFRFFLMFSPQLLCNRQSAILAEDIYRLPFPHDRNLNFEGYEKVIANELLQYVVPMVKLGASRRNPGAMACACSKDVASFAATYVEQLAPIYKTLHALEPIELENAFCIPFCFGKKPNRLLGDLSKISEKLDKLLINEGRPHLRVQRVVRLFHGNVLFYIKPKPLRFWLRSIALRDADDTFAEFLERDELERKTRK